MPNCSSASEKLKARIAQLETQHDEEHARNRDLSYAILRMPFEGVIRRNNVVEGSHVIAGNELVQILDCRDLFVDILVAEVDYDEIYPGRNAQVRLLGRSDAIDGQVMAVRGSAAVTEDVILAAKLPQSRGKDARIRVALPELSLNTDYANFCQVGRSVQVRFRTRSLPIMRWFKALWFSITGKSAWPGDAGRGILSDFRSERAAPANLDARHYMRFCRGHPPALPLVALLRHRPALSQ